MERSRRAETLRDYFDLQLRFAAAMSRNLNLPLGLAVLRYTNLHRRFGLGEPDEARPALEWIGYAEQLGRLAEHPQRLDWTQRCFVRSAPEPDVRPGQTVFGCFACDPPDAQGAVRIHFTNRDRSGSGPLAGNRTDARRRELTAMLVHLRARYPDARTIRGGSWLYSREAYRRLFPPEYRESCVVQNVAGYFQGSSRWGQFLDHREGTRPDLRATFLANLERLDPEHPWQVFPVPRYAAQASIASFYAFFGLDALR